MESRRRRRDGGSYFLIRLPWLGAFVSLTFFLLFRDAGAVQRNFIPYPLVPGLAYDISCEKDSHKDSFWVVRFRNDNTAGALVFNYRIERMGTDIGPIKLVAHSQMENGPKARARGGCLGKPNVEVVIIWPPELKSRTSQSRTGPRAFAGSPSLAVTLAWLSTQLPYLGTAIGSTTTGDQVQRAIEAVRVSSCFMDLTLRTSYTKKGSSGERIVKEFMKVDLALLSPPQVQDAVADTYTSPAWKQVVAQQTSAIRRRTETHEDGKPSTTIEGLTPTLSLPFSDSDNANRVAAALTNAVQYCQRSHSAVF